VIYLAAAATLLLASCNKILNSSLRDRYLLQLSRRTQIRILATARTVMVKMHISPQNVDVQTV